jgi:XTP/dITP diphosphohydrolase
MNNETPLHTLVLASHNVGKLIEMQACLSSSHYKLLPQSDFNIEDIPETGLTFVENALIKARHACQHTGLPALADDSGLMVDALNGAPGLYSARYSGNKASALENNEKLLRELALKPDAARTARFYAVIVFLRHAHDPLPLIAQGVWEGEILHSPQGPADFGYNPLFYVPSHHCSAAELSILERNQINHRGKALRNLETQIKALSST